MPFPGDLFPTSSAHDHPDQHPSLPGDTAKAPLAEDLSLLVTARAASRERLRPGKRLWPEQPSGMMTACTPPWQRLGEARPPGVSCTCAPGAALLPLEVMGSPVLPGSDGANLPAVSGTQTPSVSGAEQLGVHGAPLIWDTSDRMTLLSIPQMVVFPYFCQLIKSLPESTV